MLRYAQVEDDALDIELLQRKDARKVKVVVRIPVRMEKVRRINQRDLVRNVPGTARHDERGQEDQRKRNRPTPVYCK
ncbi:MAG: hypothetical protein PHC88_04715 [Terrimicrobiaceae bacterium]|nr:hypothetical protein [Terrimicrobiaceae bacterium]